MREFRFDIQYPPGVSSLMDHCVEYPELTVNSIESVIDSESVWRIEWFSGPSAALDSIMKYREASAISLESPLSGNCTATSYCDVLDRTSKKCVTYSHFSNISGGRNIYSIIARHIGSGVVIETDRHGDVCEWRILLESDKNVGDLYDSITGYLDERLKFTFQGIQEANSWSKELLGALSIPGEQRAVLYAAAEHGYYETPRETTLADLSERLDIPRSTVSYRLRRAEATLVYAYLEQ